MSTAGERSVPTAFAEARARADEVLVETSAVCAGEDARSRQIGLSMQVRSGVNVLLEVE